MKMIVVAAAVLLSGCAALAPDAGGHAAHHRAGAPGPAAVDQQMSTMQDMHRKMMSARTPEERQALMAEHMKAMQGGMSMMCEMGQGPDSPDTMKRCMDMRDMTMRMMMDREAPAAR